MHLRSRLTDVFAKVSRKTRVSIVDEVLKLKRSILVDDEVGGAFPINVSVILPTFMKEIEELSGYRYEVIRNELMVLGQLLTKGIIDEILIVDGSRDPDGKCEESLLRQIISSAHRSIPLFHDQVDLLNKFPALKDRAKLGLYDFGFKVLHQMDTKIKKAADQFKINLSDIPTGKGAGLWLATAASSGDLLIYLDSDIRNLEEWQVASLLLPILRTYKQENNHIEFVKAYYDRLSVNLDSPEKGFYKLGGRVTRLFVIPFINVLTKKGVLTGLEKFKYPLSGEFAVTRRFIETLSFPVNYGIESGMLIEIWRKKALNKVTEADLQLYQHFPRNDNLVTDMATQIVRLFLHELRGLIELDEKVVNEYLKEAYREIEQTQSLYEEVEVIISQDVRRTFYKDIEGDRRRVKKYAKVLRNALKSKGYMKEKIQKMPPWGKLVGTFKGKKFQNYLRRRAVNYTYHVLSDQRIVTYD